MGTFAAISQENSVGRRSFTNPTGFRGISQELATNVRFIRVTDFKGIPLLGVFVTVNNTGGSVTTITDSNGLAEIIPDVATNITINLRQYSMNENGITYNTTTSPLVRTIILDTIVPHL